MEFRRLVSVKLQVEQYSDEVDAGYRSPATTTMGEAVVNSNLSVKTSDCRVVLFDMGRVIMKLQTHIVQRAYLQIAYRFIGLLRKTRNFHGD